MAPFKPEAAIPKTKTDVNTAFAIRDKVTKVQPKVKIRKAEDLVPEAAASTTAAPVPDVTSEGLQQYLAELSTEDEREQVRRVMRKVKEHLGDNMELYGQDEYAAIKERMRHTSPETKTSFAYCPGESCGDRRFGNTITQKVFVGHILEQHPEMLLSATPHMIATSAYAVELLTTVDRHVLGRAYIVYRRGLIILAKRDQGVLRELLGKLGCSSPREVGRKFPDVRFGRMLLFDTPPYELEREPGMLRNRGLLRETSFEGLRKDVFIDYIVAVRNLGRDLAALFESPKVPPSG